MSGAFAIGFWVCLVLYALAVAGQIYGAVFDRVAWARRGLWTAAVGFGLHTLLVEGGGFTISRFVEAGLLDRLHVLQRLRDAGNTVVVIEHNMDVIKTADYIVDLGPEGGDAGGCVVATGTPEEVACCPGSYTGRYLAEVLG